TRASSPILHQQSIPARASSQGDSRQSRDGNVVSVIKFSRSSDNTCHIEVVRGIHLDCVEFVVGVGRASVLGRTCPRGNSGRAVFHQQTVVFTPCDGRNRGPVAEIVWPWAIGIPRSIH